MSELSANTIINLTNGKSCQVKKELGRGGQGIVYLVDYDDSEYALKWYIKEPKPEFYNNLLGNVKEGSPSATFLWPLAVTEREYDSFGYIMKLRPEGYEEVGRFMLAKVRFASVESLLEACLQICTAFQKLHIRGLSYQDMNDGNFFINPQTGDVLICDNDNVAPNRINMGIIGKSGYMAPEIVDRAEQPNRYTDYFSLAVILFILIYVNRPFEGQRVTSCPCMTEEYERKLFGRDCVFIMDPNDASNRPTPDLHKNVLHRWPLFPRLLREEFIKAFSKEANNEPQKRVMDREWQQILVQVRSQYITCPHCGEKTFVDPSKNALCICCHQPIESPLLLNVGNYKIPLVAGQIIYSVQVGENDLNEQYAEIKITPSNGKLGLWNRSKQTWTVTTSADIRNVAPGNGVLINKGFSIKFNKDTTGIITF